MRYVTVQLTDETLAIANQAVNDTDDTLELWLSEQVNKMLEAKKVQFARSRLNLHKKSVVRMIEIGDWASLEEAYIKLGLSESVDVFGGIRKVYDEIYVKSGNPLPASKIRMGGIVAVNV